MKKVISALIATAILSLGAGCNANSPLKANLTAKTDVGLDAQQKLISNEVIESVNNASNTDVKSNNKDDKTFSTKWFAPWWTGFGGVGSARFGPQWEFLGTCIGGGVYNRKDNTCTYKA